MSDSGEESVIQNNVLSFRNNNTMVCAKGPNLKCNNLSMSFRGNFLTSTMNMPRSFGSRSITSNHRSIYSVRETSPISLRSVPNSHPKRFQNIYNRSQTSMYQGRAGSPCHSIRSTDSTMSAVDIATAFKSQKFSNNELRIIRNAYTSLMKGRSRKRIEKRRKLRQFYQQNHQKFGYDSSERESDSSMSSDECRSTRTAISKTSKFNNKYAHSLKSSDSLSTKTDITGLRKTISDKNMYNNCTNNFQQNRLRNMYSDLSGIYKDESNMNNLKKSKSYSKVMENLQDRIQTQKERFTNNQNRFLLPSQRFNKVFAISDKTKETTMNQIKNVNKCDENIAPKNNMQLENAVNSESEADEIFSEVSMSNRTIVYQQKRSCHDVDDLNCNNMTKKPKLVNDNTVYSTCDTSKDTMRNDFQFAKPQFPIRRSVKSKTETLISKSVTLLEDTIVKPLSRSKEIKDTNKREVDNLEQSQLSISDIAMKTSFMKRKLFTQTLDVTENQNASNDSNSTASPRGTYKTLPKEKNKARKIVSNQSCLNRDIQEDSNLLDLIHKIVPPESITSIGNMTNRNETVIDDINTCKNSKSGDEWDVTSVISTCNNDNVSDTYTDEEIFENTTNGRKNINGSKKVKSSKRKTKSTNKNLSKASMVENKINGNIDNVKGKYNEPRNFEPGKIHSNSEIQCFKTNSVCNKTSSEGEGLPNKEKVSNNLFKATKSIDKGLKTTTRVKPLENSNDSLTMFDITRTRGKDNSTNNTKTPETPTQLNAAIKPEIYKNLRSSTTKKTKAVAKTLAGAKVLKSINTTNNSQEKQNHFNNSQILSKISLATKENAVQSVRETRSAKNTSKDKLNLTCNDNKDGVNKVAKKTDANISQIYKNLRSSAKKEKKKKGLNSSVAKNTEQRKNQSNQNKIAKLKSDTGVNSVRNSPRKNITLNISSTNSVLPLKNTRSRSNQSLIINNSKEKMQKNNNNFTSSGDIPNQNGIRNCKVLLRNVEPPLLSNFNGVKHNKVHKCVESFWNTDVESDIECLPSNSKNLLQQNYRFGKLLSQC